jgi:hypothetical protein
VHGEPSEMCREGTFAPTRTDHQIDQKGDTEMTKTRPDINCIMCGAPTTFAVESGGKVVGTNMGMCPECVRKLRGDRHQSDTEVTKDRWASDCEMCGDPIDYCQGHGEIASGK